MKFLALSSSLLLVSVVNAFSTNDVVYKSIKSAMPLSMSTSSEVASPFQQGPRIVRDELPVVYVYDHCPFCVRVRLALGVKNIKHNIHFMGNDDIPTPTKLVGKKIAPIFGIPEDDLIMSESLDIIAKVEGDERFGETNSILPASDRKDLKAWQKSVQSLLRTLQRPRYVATGLLPEFQQIDARHAFIKNHQLPPYEKSEWKGDGTDENPGIEMETKLELYAEAMAKDPASLLEGLNAKLVELDDMVFSEHYCTEGGLSMDDIDLWSRLRSITIIRGVEWPDKLRNYMDNLSALGDVPLYDQMAL
eukprot:CAMPEP_0178951720 /NCGR_PEP_ID=MMETSP0789-20121207/7389_1 /TAXON_ID=3005 /ORGANISM="Rhizosolenia setigera, Strain CCMP 1694" /LENGTH=304 /DNA_ID=CAMNT_0020632637 /DNA_START=32 /DNA_END=946 /DNA_ORIENTATION=-